MTLFYEQKRKVYQNADFSSDKTFIRVSCFEFFHPQKFFWENSRFWIFFRKFIFLIFYWNLFSENVKVIRIIHCAITSIMMVKKDLDKERMFGTIRANIFDNNFVEYFMANNTPRGFLGEHLIRNCHGCMATYSCFTRNRFHPIRIPEDKDPVFSKRPVINF